MNSVKKAKRSLLVKEINLLVKLKQDQNLDDVLGNVPSRKDIGFQVIGKLDVAKRDKARENFGDELLLG